jgi:hypothetical protein
LGEFEREERQRWCSTIERKGEGKTTCDLGCLSLTVEEHFFQKEKKNTYLLAGGRSFNI